MQEPLVFSPSCVQLLSQWGLSSLDAKGIKRPDFGGKARSIWFRDLRAFSGRLLRRERWDCVCIRPKDFCELVTECVDVSWGAAIVGENGVKEAGGVAGEGDEWVTDKQWSGAVEDESSAFRFYDDAIHMYGGKQSCAIVFRLPSNIINWSIIRPTEMEGRNALSEWRSMITSWQLNEDGSVEIPASEVMLLRESFDLFDTDKSGALDMQEVKVAIEQCGLAVSDEDLQGIIAEARGGRGKGFLLQAMQIDKDGSGEFEFVEFVELVKTLVLRIREAEDAEETAVKLRSEIDGIKLELKARQEELKLAEAKVFELRKAGAQGPLDIEKRAEAIPLELDGLKDDLSKAVKKLERAEAVGKKKQGEDELEWEVNATDRPQRKVVEDRAVLPSWVLGRMVLVGDAAHPLVPGTLMGGQELVEDARLLLECLSSHSIPAEIPNALVDFSRKRVPSAAYSHSLARRRLQLLCTPVE
ncbi:hypothetical protein GUITHDRAFT_143617 [Guillardia theta CCMP2712]|uniref:EF-hand domain-containing protein n=1 Tax=Guillardia theta (strain CCMP2712) TaxID=905079 RepID=L1ISF8_GUITC|nr:hypothetical protein GUITHDRAFT_143617 [Guillardia theta CCMP2712]EKX39206.1 hypothetical protein GUITHDRAFT_143617 [Guillardia theta CCMP2712]|eukprot:XP_005826186.1 hypothetical protein GUITHDRAFT_143617 [Guillardia theta CCMP2712]